jgi:CRISPR-associated exonuclease Cas4
VTSITVTHILQHLYCPRFTYFEYVLGIPQRQERRWKVQRGREVHLERSKINKSYLRKKLLVTERLFDVPMASEELGFRGIADEVLTFADGTRGPFDYKFSKAPQKPFRNQVFQSVLYGILIENEFGCEVNRGYICYTRDHHKIFEVVFSDRLKRRSLAMVGEVLSTIQQGHLPMATRCASRCIDCCYKNICIQ